MKICEKNDEKNSYKFIEIRFTKKKRREEIGSMRILEVSLCQIRTSLLFFPYRTSA